jgi:hypothetical protein
MAYFDLRVVPGRAVLGVTIRVALRLAAQQRATDE